VKSVTLLLSATLACVTAACGGPSPSNSAPPAVPVAAPEAPQAAPQAVALRVLEDVGGPAQVIGDAVLVEPPPEVTEYIPNYVIRWNRRWTPGQSLKVCFMGGDAALRNRIRTAAAEWTRHANLALDFGPESGPHTCGAGDTSEIRVGFQYAGYWSVVGNTPVRAGLQTMNYTDFPTAPPAEPRFTGTVLHEFGHALGFEHEHQHPDGGCDAEFNWPVVYTELAKPPNNWPASKVDFNLRSFTDRSAYGLSAPDRTSIMHYSLDPWMFRNGESSRCYVREQFELSALDKAGAADAYPARGEQLLTQQRRQIDQLKRSLPTRGADAARDYLEALGSSISTRQREMSRQ
jgi:Astacin (Peptidase family M12A)